MRAYLLLQVSDRELLHYGSLVGIAVFVDPARSELLSAKPSEGRNLESTIQDLVGANNHQPIVRHCRNRLRHIQHKDTDIPLHAS